MKDDRQALIGVRSSKNIEYRTPISDLRSVFVLQSDYYGFKMRKNRIKLVSELKPELINSKEIWFDDYFFKDSTLIYTGTLQSKAIIDSLIKVVTP